MSAWYIFSAMGFYPVCPGSDYYSIGSPSFRSVKLKLSNGKEFIVKANNLSPDHFYIQSARLNGEKFSNTQISYNDIKNGGILEFEMGAGPNKSWGIE